MIELTTQIHETLESYALPDSSTTYFAKVFKGEPLALMPSNGQALARWHVKSVGPAPEGPRVVSGAMMRTAVFGVVCVWPLTASEGKARGIEDDIAAVCADLPPRLCVPALTASDYTVGGVPVSTITIEDLSPVDVGLPVNNPQAEGFARLFQFDIHARLLEES